ncbi:hypothetical protein AGMMS49992_21390 [Clostridia bacterium]|nr:hypothetical protein AGMMS49992_21390 [Clostridia bacterium]
MDKKYNVAGERRKQLVQACSEILNIPAVYKGMPTAAFDVGAFSISKEGTLSYDNQTDNALVEKLITGLTERGFEYETDDFLTIEMPIDGFSEESITNLEKLIASKATLIKKAVGTDTVEVTRTSTTLRFPWFKSTSASDEVKAYATFIGRLCALAKIQKRVTATEHPILSEKYSFRCFLIRLGMSGNDYRLSRKILTRNLTGSSAWKNGPPAKGDHVETKATSSRGERDRAPRTPIEHRRRA